jgi:hypothetical protein
MVTAAAPSGSGSLPIGHGIGAQHGFPLLNLLEARR